MDSILINQLVNKQLEAIGIKDGRIYILEKEWGYVVEIHYRNNMKFANELFDKEGNIIYPLGYFEYDSGDIYCTEVQKTKMDRGINVENLELNLPFYPEVRYVDLDDNHFIIPRLNEKGIGSTLFFVNGDKNVTYKGYIQGKVEGNGLRKLKKLMETKQVLVYREINKNRDEYEYFFYSWDRNCRISDKWSDLIQPNDFFMVADFLKNKIGLPKNFTYEIFNYMKLNEAWLATLKLDAKTDDAYNPKNNKYRRYFLCLVGLNGMPLIDLTYVTPTYEVDTIPLKKEKVGEVDELKQLLQERMDKQASQIELNKKNIVDNFLERTDLYKKDIKNITDIEL